MAKRSGRAQPSPKETDAMLQAASLPPDQQMSEVLRFIRADLENDPTNWSGFLKGLPRRPCASASGRLKVQWLTVVEPRTLSRALLERLQVDLRKGIRDVLKLEGYHPVFPGIWNLPVAPAQLAMVDDPAGGFVWQYLHVRDVGAEDAQVPGIVLAVAQLVAEHADRIRLCKLPDCNVIFLANRHQEFCTVPHGQRARDQKKKEK